MLPLKYTFLIKGLQYDMKHQNVLKEMHLHAKICDSYIQLNKAIPPIIHKHYFLQCQKHQNCFVICIAWLSISVKPTKNVQNIGGWGTCLQYLIPVPTSMIGRIAKTTLHITQLIGTFITNYLTKLKNLLYNLHCIFLIY